MSIAAAAHIPVLAVPNFKTLGVQDDALVDVLEPGPEKAPEPSQAELLAAEYERGLEEGNTRTRSHFETVLDKERNRHAKDLEDERLRFEMRESANISAAIDGCLNVMEQRISYSLARLLQPFLEDKAVDKLVCAFAESLKSLTEDQELKLVRLSGPETLVTKVLAQVPHLENRIEVECSDTVELKALLDETILETRLSQWLAKLNDIHQEAG